MSSFPFGDNNHCSLQQLVVWTSPLPKARLPPISFSEPSSLLLETCTLLP